jgi:hypothetical protein
MLYHLKKIIQANCSIAITVETAIDGEKTLMGIILKTSSKCCTATAVPYSAYHSRNLLGCGDASIF